MNDRTILIGLLGTSILAPIQFSTAERTDSCLTFANWLFVFSLPLLIGSLLIHDSFATDAKLKGKELPTTYFVIFSLGIILSSAAIVALLAHFNGWLALLFLIISLCTIGTAMGVVEMSKRTKGSSQAKMNTKVPEVNGNTKMPGTK